MISQNEKLSNYIKTTYANAKLINKLYQNDYIEIEHRHITFNKPEHLWPVSFDLNFLKDYMNELVLSYYGEEYRNLYEILDLQFYISIENKIFKYSYKTPLCVVWSEHKIEHYVSLYDMQCPTCELWSNKDESYREFETEKDIDNALVVSLALFKVLDAYYKQLNMDVDEVLSKDI